MNNLKSNGLVKSFLSIVLVFVLTSTTVHAEVPQEQAPYMSQLNIKQDLTPGKSVTVYTNVYKIGYKKMKFKIIDYTKSELDSQNMQITLTACATIPWKFSKKEVDRLYKNTSKKYSICTWGTAFVNYNTGYHCDYQNSENLKITTTGWKHQQRKKYRGTHGNTVDVYRKNIIKYIITCPKTNNDVCFGVYGSKKYNSNLKSFFNGSVPFGSSDLYKSKKTLSHWMHIYAQ